MLRAVHAGGVTHFDCASIAEVALVRQMFPDAAIHFMHPIKSRGAIREAWARHDVRDFVLDSAEELAKIRHEIAATGVPGKPRPDRPPRAAEGLGGAGSVRQIRRRAGAGGASCCARPVPHAARLGLSFHVGSQCLDPLAWRDALALAGEVIRDAGVPVEVIDIGGGFAGRVPGRRAAAARRLSSRRSRRGSSGSVCRRRGCGPSPAARWSPEARPSSCRCSIGVAMRSTSTTACMARWRTPARSGSAIRCG